MAHHQPACEAVFTIHYQSGREEKNMKFTQPRNGNYYDLVRTPHGHIPAPRIRLWSWLPIPVKGQRTYNTFHCPTCGSPSFFKVRGHCNECGPIYDDDEQQWKTWAKKEATRNKWKQFEEIVLPLLVLIGKAWYMPSDRLNYLEQVKKYGPGLNVEPWMEDDEDLDLLLDEPTGENCSICGKPLTQGDEIAAPDHPQCCEEHGDYLDLCEECWDTWMMQCQEPEGFIRKCHFDESECYEATDERVRCEMVKEGWEGIIIHCEKHPSLASKELRRDEK